jgi:hypothetical protein
MTIVTPVASAAPPQRGRVAADLVNGEVDQRRAPGGGESLQFAARQVLVVEQPGSPVLAHEIGKHMLVRKHDPEITWLNRAGHRHDLHGHILPGDRHISSGTQAGWEAVGHPDRGALQDADSVMSGCLGAATEGGRADDHRCS